MLQPHRARVPERRPSGRVLLADDDQLVLVGLTMMLGGSNELEVIGHAHDGRDVLSAVDLHHPDVVLMDIRIPRMDGIEATRLLHARQSHPQVIMLTTFHADELVLRALQAGAAGYLLRNAAPIRSWPRSWLCTPVRGRYLRRSPVD